MLTLQSKMVVNNKKKYKERKGHRNFTVGYVRRCKKKKMEKHKTPDQQDEREKKTRRKQKLSKNGNNKKMASILKYAE
mgnify:FL=1